MYVFITAICLRHSDAPIGAGWDCTLPATARRERPRSSHLRQPAFLLIPSLQGSPRDSCSEEMKYLTQLSPPESQRGGSADQRPFLTFTLLPSSMGRIYWKLVNAKSAQNKSICWSPSESLEPGARQAFKRRVICTPGNQEQEGNQQQKAAVFPRAARHWSLLATHRQREPHLWLWDQSCLLLRLPNWPLPIDSPGFQVTSSPFIRRAQCPPLTKHSSLPAALGQPTSPGCCPQLGPHQASRQCSPCVVPWARHRVIC